MLRFKHSYLISAIILASLIDCTELVSLRGRRSVDENNSTFASLHFLIGIFVVATVVSSWITWSNTQKKREEMRADLFEQNGGNLLRRRRNIHELSVYTAQSIKSITDNYNHAKNEELRGCSPGAFYRGTLHDSTEVAVVMIERVPAPQMNRFVDQLIFLSKPHPNMVKLRGCCLETQYPLLVYELRGRGDETNDTLLYLIRTSRILCRKRVRVAAGAAKGLKYLNSRFVHGNICSANILMDISCKNNNPEDITYNANILYVAGSNLRDTSSWQQGHSVYMDPDPEFMRTRRPNKKSDVYSFGVVLLEVLTGKKINDMGMALEYVGLAEAGHLNHEVVRDAEMIGEGDGEVVKKVAALAESCLKVEPGQRPYMKKVVAKLTTILTMENDE